MDFQGKRVLVTGGARGIGKAIARGFAERGAKVMVSYHSNHEAAKETLDGLAGEGHSSFAGDIAQPEVAKALIETTQVDLGGLDILVNNAGIFEEHPVDSCGFESWQAAWQKTLGINLLAAANLCYLSAQIMMGQGGGRIVNVSSRGAFRGEPESPAYGASKAGLNAMSQSLAQKLAPHKIYVGVVAPGFVETDMAFEHLKGERGEAIRSQSPLKRVATPEEVAYAVMFLASEGAEFSTGAIIDVNGASYLRS
ncbi:MAG: SDR family oxidoreductase [Trueperaceae bacterium]|nr:SDR family oxidoreductase [Trueperaceae bacterium]